VTRAQVGENIEAGNSAWSFAGHTAEVFDTHVRRSVPMYEAGHDIVCGLSDFFVHDDSVVYELGVSTGELMAHLIRRHAHRPKVKWVGVDIEADMIRRAKERVGALDADASLVCADAVDYDLAPADMVVSYYFLQFIPPRYRQDVVNRIYHALTWGGAFVLFEKVRGPDARFQDILSLLYTDFKLANDYSPDEIVGKSRSLKGVLEPFSTEGNLGLLRRAGFEDIAPVFRHLCFEGVLAIK
jgi:tRNA (cmo5U34)-methyltransferase